MSEREVGLVPVAVLVARSMEESRDGWRELYDSLFGLVRNTIRTGASAKQRIDEIDAILAASLLRHRAREDADDKVPTLIARAK